MKKLISLILVFVMCLSITACDNSEPNETEEVSTSGEVIETVEETGKIYAKCSKCGAPPMEVYIDFDGIQISYEEKLLNEVKNIMCEIEQKICNLEIKMEMIERGQEVLEESLAYINQYMLQQR